MCKRILLCLVLLMGISRSAQAAALSLSSASAIVVEADGGEVLYEKDAHTARPMASTTKLMTALITAQTLPLEQEITVSASAVAVEGSALGLRAGDHITVRDLLTGLLLVSGNDAANVAAEAVATTLPAFAERMNHQAQLLHMQDSYFVTPSGLDAAGHAASAYDMALLGRAVLQNEFLKQVCATKSTRITFGDPKREVWVSNHNRLLKICSDCIGMKTGFTKRSGKCLVSAAIRDGVTVVAVTLNGGDYWNDHLKLYDYAFSKLERVNLPNITLQPLAVAGGEQTQLTVQTASPPAVTLHRGEGARITTSLTLPPMLWAPIQQGETVGKVVYAVDGKMIYQMPVTAAETVAQCPPLSKWRLWWRQVRHLLRYII